MNKKITIIGIILCAIGIVMDSYINTGIEKVYVVKGDTLLPEKIDLKYKEIKVIEEEKSGDNFFDKYY